MTNTQNPTRLRRIALGEYATPDGRYRAIHGWADSAGWTLLRVVGTDRADVLDTLPRLKDCRAEIARVQ